MADVFLLTEKQKKHTEKVYLAIKDALEAVSVNVTEGSFELTDEQLQTVAETIKGILSPKRQAQQAAKLLAKPHFMLMSVAKYRLSPNQSGTLAKNEFKHEGQFYLAYNEWYFLRSGNNSMLKTPYMEPIAEDSEAYHLLGDTPDPQPLQRTEADIEQIRALLGLEDYSYTTFLELYELELIQFLCSEIAELPTAQAKHSFTASSPLAIRPDGESFYNVPEGLATDLILGLMIAGEDIDSLGDSKKQFNHGQKITVAKKKNNRLVTLENSKASVSVAVTDIEKLTKSNKTAKKLFVLTLIKANEQAIHDGQLSRDYVCFPLQELVDMGFYKSLNSARTGFNAGADTITSFKVRGHIERNKKKTINSANTDQLDALEVLFTGARIKDNQCYVFLNPRINWGFIVEYFTILPRYYFKLPNRASDLLYYIFYLARQHTKDLEERGYFNISFRAIQHRLQLPDEKGLNNPQRDIKDAILTEAIEPIEDEHHAMYNNEEFHLTPHCDETLPASAFLDTGYLTVELKGAYASTFIELSKKTAKQIETRQKKQERIEEKARAINLAKKIEQGEKGKDTADKDRSGG